MRALTLFAGVGIALVTAIAQQPRAWNIEGRVTSDNGAVTGARLSAIGPGRVEAVTTDTSGRYLLAGTTPGRYLISARRESYAPSSAKSVTLAAGSHVHSLDFHLSPHSIVSGRVFGADRNPVSGASVAVLVKTFRGGRLSLLSKGDAVTDDLGVFRIPDLGEGRYFLAVVPKVLQPRKRQWLHTVYSGASAAVSRIAFYPNAPSLDGASPVVLSPGEEREGTDILLGNADPFCVFGTVVPPLSPAQAVLQLYARTGDAFFTVASGEVQPGEWEICGVTPGEYTLLATLWDRRTNKAIGFLRREIFVSKRDLDLGKIRPLPGLPLQGNLDIETQSKGEALATNLTLELLRRGRPIIYGDDLRAGVQPPGLFAFQNIFPDDYGLSVQGLSTRCYVRSALQLGRNVMYGPVRPDQGVLSVSVACDGGVVRGQTVDDNKAPAADATVILVPKESPPGTLVLSQQSDQQGNFEFSSQVAPGDYFLAAFKNLYEGEGQDPEFVRGRLSSASELTVPSKGSKFVTLITQLVR